MTEIAARNKVVLLEHHSNLSLRSSALAAVLLLPLLYFGLFFLHGSFTEQPLGGNRMDGALYLWLLQERAAAPFSLAGGMFFPYSLTAAFSDNFILPGLLYAILQRLGFGLVLSYNSILIAALYVGAFLSFQWLVWRGARFEVALLSAFAFASVPFFTLHIGHPQLLGVFGIPMLFFSFELYCNRNSRLAATAIGASICLSFYFSVYYAIFLSFALLLLLGHATFSEGLKPRSALRLILYNLPWLALLVPSVLPYLAVQERFGSRSLAEVRNFSGAALALFRPAYSNAFWGTRFGEARAFESQLFPGALLLVVFLWGLLSGRHLRRGLLLSLSLLFAFAVDGFGASAQLQALSYYLPFGVACVLLFRSDRGSSEMYAALAVLFLVLSWGTPTRAAPFSPFALLWNAVPGFSAIRAPGRIIVLFYFCAIASTAFRTLEWQGRSRFRHFGILLLLPLLLFEVRPRYLYAPQGPERPQIYQELARHSRPGEAGIALPILAEGSGAERYVRAQSEYMLWLQSAVDRYPHGHSGISPKFNALLPWRLRYFPSEKSLATLSITPELRWIVFHADRARAEASALLPQFSAQLSEVAVDAEGNRVLRFTPGYAAGSHQLRLSTDAPSKLRFELRLAQQLAETEAVEVLLGCGEGQEEAQRAVLSTEQPRLMLGCELSAKPYVVSAQLLDLEVRSSREGVLVLLEQLERS